MLKSLTVLLTLILLGVASGCKKNKQPYFPNVGFEQYIYLNNASSNALNHPGGWVFHEGGYGGLIIYRRYIQGGSDDFAIYDRACPSHFNEGCGILEISDDGIFAVCPCQKEKYLLIDGSPSTGASLPLRSYQGSRNGQVLYVSN